MAQRQFPYPLDPFMLTAVEGMTDTLDPAAGREGRARLILNGYLPPGPPGTPVAGRPGSTQAGALGGDAGARRGQYVGQFTEDDGTQHTIRIVGGKFYEYDWGMESWTETLSAANFSAASVTVSTTARIFATPFAGQMVFTDGVNTPWMWDGTPGGGMTELTNAPVCYGQPVVYYSKLFLIKSVERTTFVWSEEGDATTGYETGGFNNAWNPLGAGALTAFAATNESLYVAQSRRILRVQGAVTTDFQTSGTRSDVSETIGTETPLMLVMDRGVAFVDADGHPHLIAGTELVPLWVDAKETLATIPRITLSLANLVEYTPADLLIVELAETGYDAPNLRLVYRLSAPVLDLCGLWRGWTSDVSGMVADTSNVPRWMHLGENTGYAVLHGNPTDGVWNDVVEGAGTTTAIEHRVETHALGADLQVEKRFERADFVLAPPTDMTLSVSLTTPRGTDGPHTMTVEASGGFVLDVAQLDIDSLSAQAAEVHAALGVGRSPPGRWASLTVAHAVSSERFGFVGLALDAIAVDHAWGAP